MAKGRIWVIVKKYKGHDPSDCMFTELETLSDITEVMKDINKVGIAFGFSLVGLGCT